MTAKRPSYNALLRKIERLEAAMQSAHIEQQLARQAASEYLRQMVEWKCRVKQAIAILNGEDE